jgi:hypothetical protein
MDENKRANELNEALKGMWDSLTDEQKEKAKQCQSMDELMQLAGKLGVELPDEILDSVAGGVNLAVDKLAGKYALGGFGSVKSLYCPYCGKYHNFDELGKTDVYGNDLVYLNCTAYKCLYTGRNLYVSADGDCHFNDAYKPVPSSGGSRC